MGSVKHGSRGQFALDFPNAIANEIDLDDVYNVI